MIKTNGRWVKGAIVACLMASAVVLGCALIGEPLILLTLPSPSGADFGGWRWLIFLPGDNGFQHREAYYVDQPWPEVVAFYREEMSRRGWQLAEEKIKPFPKLQRLWVCMAFTRYNVSTVGIQVSGYQPSSSDGKEGVFRRTVVDTVALAPDFSRAVPVFDTAFERLSCDP